MMFRIARSRDGGSVTHYDLYKVDTKKGMTYSRFKTGWTPHSHSGIHAEVLSVAVVRCSSTRNRDLLVEPRWQM